MNRSQALEKLKHYKELNAAKYGIEQIGIFGSVARDEAKANSDVDICLKTKVADMFMLVHIKEELSKLFAADVDIVRLREKMNPFLKKRIHNEAIYV